MPSQNRPLSPHLQVYRLHLIMLVSGGHRISGLGLLLGTLLLVYWLAAAASGPEAFDLAQTLIGSFIGRLFLFGWSFALFYHLCTGIRHLVWDTGHGFALADAQRSAIAVLVASVLLTMASWALGYALGIG